MTRYRAYFLTPQNRIFHFVELESDSDAEAKRRAAVLLRCDTIEIWQGGRKVCRLDPPAQAEHRHLRQAQQC